MSSEFKIITIEEAQALLPGSFPSASGLELKRCPMKTELLANGFTITGTSRTYSDNQVVVASDLGGYDVSYGFANVAVRYSNGSSGNMIWASGSNYAYIQADVIKYIGGRPVSTATSVTLTSVKVSGDGFYLSGSTQIRAENRGMVTGDTRDGTFYGKYTDSIGVTARTSNVTATQAANYATQNKVTQSATYRRLVATDIPGSGVYSYEGREVVSSDYGVYYALLSARFSEWTSYSSGAGTTPISTSGEVSATTYVIPSAVQWAGLYADHTKFYANSNGTDVNRTGSTITARYSGGTDAGYTDVTFTLEQFRQPYSYTDFRISQYGIDKTVWQNTEYGTGSYGTITATCQYNTTVWKNGTETPGTWTTYTSGATSSVPYAVVPQNHFKFYGYDGTSGSQYIDLYYPTTTITYGSARVYPYDANTGVSDITNTLNVNYGNAQRSIILTHKGDGSFSIYPTSLSMTYRAQSKTITVTTQLSDWSVSDDAGWITTSVSGNVVTVTVTENTSTTNRRSGTITFTQGGRTVATCSVEQDKAPIPPIPNVETLFELGGGWIVGRYQTGVIPDQYNTKIYTLIIGRSDRGNDCTINFSEDGYYNYHIGPETTQHSWAQSSVEYTGQQVSATDYFGNTVEFYGIRPGGGPGAETSQYYAGITIS